MGTKVSYWTLLSDETFRVQSTEYDALKMINKISCNIFEIENDVLIISSVFCYFVFIDYQ